MASRDLRNNIAVRNGLTQTTIVVSGATAGEIIDTHGFDSLTYIMKSGTLAGTALLVPRIEESDASNMDGHVDAVDYCGTPSLGAFSPTDDNAYKKLGYRGGKRYARLCIDGDAVGVHAGATVAFNTIVADNTITVNGVTFTAKVAPAGEEQFALGATDFTAMAAFVAAVNAHSTVGLIISALDILNKSCTLTAIQDGAAGNAYTLAKVGAPVTISGATFASGADGSAVIEAIAVLGHPNVGPVA